MLFVAEKSVAVDEVVERLVDAGSRTWCCTYKTTRKCGSASPASSPTISTRRESSYRCGTTASTTRLADRRGTLANHARELHQSREPWGPSIYDAQSQLLKLAGCKSDIRLPRSTLHALTGEVADDVVERLRDEQATSGAVDADATPAALAGVGRGR